MSAALHQPIAFLGMTHLGINHAAAAAALGFSVIGFDPDPALAESLASGRLPVMEPGLPELLHEHGRNIRFSADPADLADVALCYVAPDVATDEAGRSDLTVLRSLIALADQHLSPETVMVVLSQVPPGFTRSLPRQPETLFYQVETLIFGRAVERALKPERYILGCADPSAPLPPPLQHFLEAFGCPILPMRYESAELTKIAINLFLVSSVSTTNTIAELCERIGADWAEMAPALRLDRRIGPHAYLSPGLGVAGGNLERDLATFTRLASAHGSQSAVVSAWAANSRYRKDWVLARLHEHVFAHKPDAALALLGLAYKENTHSTKNSPALNLLKSIGPRPVAAYDPVVRASAEMHPGLRQAADALDACRGADALVVMTPWPAFAELDPAALAAVLAGRIVIDPYRVLDPTRLAAAGLHSIVLGAPNFSAFDSRTAPC